MRNELSRGSSFLPDGAMDFGNGVIGPSIDDIKYFNSLHESPKQTFTEQAELLLAQENLVPISQKSRLGEFINHFIPKLPRWALVPAAGIISLAAVSCGDGGNAPKDSGNPTPQTAGALVGTETPSQAAGTPRPTIVNGTRFFSIVISEFKKDPLIQLLFFLGIIFLILGLLSLTMGQNSSIELQYALVWKCGNL